MNNIVNRRFSHRWGEVESKIVSDYLYHITAAPGSGEYSMNSLLQPIIYSPHTAKTSATNTHTTSTPNTNTTTQASQSSTINDTKPPRKESVPLSRGYTAGIFAREPLVDELRAFKKPILLLYGDNDWLHYPEVDEHVSQWNGKYGMNVSYITISNAGHHLYLDNAQEFNDTVINWSRQQMLSQR